MEMNIADLKEGMILSQNIMNFNGQLLLQKGLSLSAKHLLMLKKWGIEAVHIASTKEKIDSSVSTAHDSDFLNLPHVILPGSAKMRSIMQLIYAETLKTRKNES